jgi:hypothetical protein
MAKTTPPNRRALLARADVRIYQCLIIDSKYQRRNIVVWQCGDDVLYSSSMDGLFDPARRREAPEWLVKQVTKPEDFTVLLTHLKGEQYSGNGKATGAAAIKTVGGPDGGSLDLDEDGIAQG